MYFSNLSVVDADNLNRSIEFDSPFRVVGDLADGRTVIENRLADVYAPEVYLYVDREGNGVGEEEINLKDWREATEWEPMNGYSGQYGYSGPTMHASEFVGGRMAEDVLADVGGVYVAVTVECQPNWDASEEEQDEYREPAGWMLLKRKDIEE